MGLRFLILALLALPATADEVTLGDLLVLYEREGHAIVYSTGVVDESVTVEVPADLTLAALERLLSPWGLRLKQAAPDQWVVVPERGNAIVKDVPASPGLEAIVVTASRYELEGGNAAAVYRLDAAQIAASPSFGGDSLRVIHRLPGAASLGVSTRPNIRGGDNDELLVVFDGLELIEPFHMRDFQSMFSSLNPRTIQRVEYFTGGFPARYGNKLSGVLDIAAEEQFEKAGGELGLSNYWASALLFSEWGEVQGVMSARRGNVDLALDVVNPDVGAPRFYDLYGSLARTFDNGSRGKVSALYFKDDILFESDEERARSEVDNGYLWLEWRTGINAPVETRSHLSLGRINSRRLGERFADRAEGFLTDHRDLRVIDFKHLRQTRFGRTDLTLGLSLKFYDMDYQTRVEAERADVASFLGLPLAIDHRDERSVHGFAGSSFVTARVQATDRLALQFGLRLDRQTYGVQDSQLSPRLALVYEPLPDWRLRLSYGQFHQPHEVYELKTADRETSFSPAQRSDHWIGAIEHRLGRSIMAKFEVFYKDISRPRPRYVNLFDPYRFSPEMEPDRVVVLADSAFSRGVEVSIAGQHDNLNWLMNYTRSQVRDFEAGRWIDRRWDQTHSVNAMVNWQNGPWEVGLAANWHTGWTMTRIPLAVPVSDPFVTSRFRSNDRLDSFATLDAKVSYTLEWPQSSLQWFVEITNLMNRSNKGGVDYEISLSNDVYTLDEVDLEPVFPLVPNLGLVWRF